MARATSSELVSAVAHELRSPVAAVRGAADALRRGGSALDGETRDRLLRVIVAGAEQLSRLADDLLVAGRLEAGRLGVEVEPCDVAPLAAAVLDAARAQDPLVELRLVAPAGLPAVSADPARLRQVLTNLVDNAIRHGRGTVEVGAEAGAGRLRVTVADEGPGIPEEERERIFERFHRLPGAGASGTGLGLYLARELVEAMGGSITVSSRAGYGSIFTVDLPLSV